VLVCLEAIAEKYREAVMAKLAESGRDIIPISLKQMASFSACVMELRGHKTNESPNGAPLIVLSRRAFNALSDQQKERIISSTRGGKFIAAEFDIIERIGGGSIPAIIGQLF
jgi:hypothetical protein